ncbi:MAG: carboxypeptidase regulatory-like domain-containing protein [Bacteroidota bacterium]
MGNPIYKVCCVLLLLGSSASLTGVKGQNVLQGNILMPAEKGKFFGIYQGYQKKSASSLTGEEAALNHPDQNVFVSLHPKDFQPELIPTPNVYITQKEESFLPKVVAVTKGSTVYLLNEDNQYHNVYSRTPKAIFNIGRRPPGHSYPQKINKIGVVRLFCDIHEQMQGYILSYDTPYFTRVDENGVYRLENLPDGSYRMEVLHPGKPKLSLDVELSGGTTQNKDIDLEKGL